MGDEPTLYEGDLGVNGWVKVLQQTLLDKGFDPHGIDGKFKWRTAQAVVAFQRAKGLKVDGRVGNQTWAALYDRAPEPPGVNNPPFGAAYAEPEVTATGPPDTTAQTPATPAPAATSAPATTPTQPAANGQLYPDGEPTEPGGFLPTFRVNIPDGEVEKRIFDLGPLVVTVTLSFGGGQLQVTPPAGATVFSVDQNGYRMEVQQQVGDFFSGIRINGLGGGITQAPMSLGTRWGSEFATTEVRVISPTQYAHIGRVSLQPIDVPTSAGVAQLSGAFGFQVLFEIIPKPPPPVPVDVPWYESVWDAARDGAESAWDFVDEHSGEILVGAVIVGVIVVAPEAAPAVLRFAL